MVALLPSFQILATFCTLAFAAPAPHLHTRGAHPHTHNVRSIPNGLVMRTYQPRSTFKLYDRGIDHPLSKRAEPATVRAAGMAYMTEQLGDGTTWQSTLERKNSSAASHVYAFQQINGIPVSNAVASVAINKAGKVASFTHNFVKSTTVASATPRLTAKDAEKAASSHLTGSLTGYNTTLAYYALEDDTLALTHAVELKLGNKHTVSAFIDAHDGSVRGMIDFTNNLSFRVVNLASQDPSDGTELENDPENLNVSPQGWNTVNGTQTGQLIGNNAFAFINGNQNDIGIQSEDGSFDFQEDLTVDPTDPTNQAAAMTNAFVVVNKAHDIYSLYGFTESAFNFQIDNFGNGGQGNDPVSISVQDPSGTDNAQFTTLADGRVGEMQMFLFTATPVDKDGAMVNVVVAHEMTHGLTNRLTGGGTGACLNTLESGGLGEGWSDAFAEWTEQQTGEIVDFAVAPFLVPGGIRTFPYSTNHTTNPLTFSDVQALDEVHNIGEVWAVTLHGVNDALIKANGFSNDSFTNADGNGGNTVWLHLFMDALAIQPCGPTFLDARAAWIQADVNRFNGANACTLWAAFADRGMGPDASNGVDDFDVPVSCGGNGSEVASTGDGSDAAGSPATSPTSDGQESGSTQTGGNRGGRRRKHRTFNLIKDSFIANGGHSHSHRH